MHKSQTTMLSNLEYFDKLAAAFGNRYAAVNYICKLARQNMNCSPRRILDSEALSWAITGEQPRPIKRSNTAKLYLSLPVSQTLQLVDNIAVRKSVIRSLSASIYHHICKYGNTLYIAEDVPNYTENFISDYVVCNSTRDIPLLFMYDDRLTSSEQARVRILTRLIWLRE